MQRIRYFLKDLSILIRTNLWLVPVLSVLVASVFFLVAPPPPMHATFSTGAEDGVYARFGERLKQELDKQGFELILLPSSGSRGNLNNLVDGKANIGLVQSGMEQTLEPRQLEGLQSLGALYREPVWLFTRQDATIDRLSDLLQWPIAYGAVNSGTRSVTEALLQANGIPAEKRPDNWLQIGGNKAANALLSGEVQAAFFIGPAEAELIQRLAASEDLHLADFHRSAAYQARLPYLSRIDVGEGLLNLSNNMPDRDLVTLGPEATLVVNENFHAALTPLILAAAREVLKEGNLLDAPGDYPAAKPISLPLHEDAEHYYSNGLPYLQRYLPFRIASLADRYIILLIPLLVVLFPLFKVIGPLYRWRIRARIYRWYRYLREVDRKLDKGTLQEDLDGEIKRLEELEDELSKVEVPLSYTHELYELHLHVRYVVERLYGLRDNRQDSAATGQNS